MKKIFLFSFLLLSFALGLTISIFSNSQNSYADIVNEEYEGFYELSVRYREEIFFTDDKFYTGPDALVQAKNEIYTKLNENTPNKYIDSILGDNGDWDNRFTNSGVYLENYQYVTDNLFYYYTYNSFNIPVGSKPGVIVSRLRDSFDCLLSRVAYWKVSISDYTVYNENQFIEDFNLEFAYLTLEEIPDLSFYVENDVDDYILLELRPIYFTDEYVTINCEDVNFIANTFGVNATTYNLPITEYDIYFDNIDTITDEQYYFNGFVHCYAAIFPYVGNGATYKYAVCNGLSSIKCDSLITEDSNISYDFAGYYCVYVCPFKLIEEPSIDIHIFEDQKALLNFMSSYTGKQYSASWILGIADFFDKILLDDNSVIANIGSTIGSIGTVTKNTTGTIADLFVVFEDMSANVRLWGIYLLAGIITAFVIFLILKIIGFVLGVFGLKTDRRRNY